jgi:hypothetical protein
MTPAAKIVSQQVSLRIDAHRVASRDVWMNDMFIWAQDNGICIIWQGESTHELDGRKWYEANIEINDTERNATWFILRWSS